MSRITSVEPIVLKIPFDDGSAGIGIMPIKWTSLEYVLVKVTTDEGFVGWSDIETLASAALACINGPGMSILGFRCLRELCI